MARTRHDAFRNQSLKQTAFAGFLLKLVMAEWDDRTFRRAQRRLYPADSSKRLEEFNVAADPRSEPATIPPLSTGDCRHHQQLCLISDSGTHRQAPSSADRAQHTAAKKGYRVE